MSPESVIRAAGVVVIRDRDGSREFLAVHRPGHGDWSLPKGKLEPGEHVLAAAVRECDEETGYTPVLGVPLPTQMYEVLGQPKVVNYWRATTRSEEGFTPDDEVDDIRWNDVDDAAQSLTYPGDATLVAAAVATPATTPLVILRHTQAMKRSDFKGGSDSDRPLTGKGRSQSKALIPLLDGFGIEAVYASSATRCVETVRRFAKTIGVAVQADDELTEELYDRDPTAAADRARVLAHAPGAVVVCSHRPVLPTILDALASELSIEPGVGGDAWHPKLAPGGFIVVHREFTQTGGIRAVAVERHTLSGE